MAEGPGPLPHKPIQLMMRFAELVNYDVVDTNPVKEHWESPKLI